MPVPASSVPLTLLGDERLARMTATGNERAFAALYGRYRERLYGYCHSILYHGADAQDALQSTFAAAYAALRDGRRDAPLRPWLYRIAHNEAISLLRRRPAHRELSEEIPASGARVEDRAAERERLERLVADLRQLPERQRSALIMREFSGMSHDSIAAALKTSAGAAKQAIFEARRSLAELEQGRSMPCHEVCRIISDRDGRALRSKKVRSHVRDCADCGAFAAAIPRRAADLRALAPALPPAVAAGILARASGGAGSGVGGAGPATVGMEANAAVGLANVKVAASVLLAAAATAGGVVEVSRLPLGSRPDSQPRPIEVVSGRGSPRASESRSAADASVGHLRAWPHAAAGGKTAAAPPRAAQPGRGSAGIAPASGSVADASSGSAGPGGGAGPSDPPAVDGDSAPPPRGTVGGSSDRSQTPGAAAVGRAPAWTPAGSARGCEGQASACSGAAPSRPPQAGGSQAVGPGQSAANGNNPNGGPVTGPGSLASGAGSRGGLLPPAPGLTGGAPLSLTAPRTPGGPPNRAA
jgi:RNA polymerase sigma factor (sigma-70 family)